MLPEHMETERVLRARIEDLEGRVKKASESLRKYKEKYYVSPRSPLRDIISFLDGDK
jgi:hypothetical protein